MSFHDAVFNVISSLTGQKNIIPIPVEFIRFTGDYHTAALLNQIIYWTERTNDPEGWFYKSYEEWESEIALNKYFVSKSIKLLIQKGIIETVVRKINNNTVLHYRLLKETFSELFISHLDTKVVPEEPRSQQPPGNANFALPEVKCEKEGGRAFLEVQSLNFQKCKVLTSLPLYTETTYRNYDDEEHPPKNDFPTSVTLPTSPSSSSSSLKNEFIKKIPASLLSPSLETILDESVKKYGPDYVEKAVSFALQTIKKKTPDSFRAYLDKTIENKWHEQCCLLSTPVYSSEAAKREDEKEQDRKREQAELKRKFDALTLLKNENPEKFQELEIQAKENLGLERKKRLPVGSKMSINFEIQRLMQVTIPDSREARL